MRVLIIDDEQHARAKLRRMLEQFPDVQVTGEVADGRAAVTRCAQLSPHAIFLDMQMPEMDGFAVIAHLVQPRPAVVLVTAFEQHALHAFDAEVTDYLLKPVAADRLQRSVQRLRTLIAPAVPLSEPTQSSARLLVQDRCKTTIIDHSNIEWLESADNYVHVHVGGRSCLVRRTLASVLDELGPGFVRIHRCFAVPLRRVLAVHAQGNGGATVVLLGALELPCSRQHKQSLLEQLSHGLLNRHQLGSQSCQ